jgi:hypothetical protein
MLIEQLEFVAATFPGTPSAERANRALEAIEVIEIRPTKKFRSPRTSDDADLESDPFNDRKN